MSVELKDVKKGARYRVAFEDCCVRGEFVGVFQGFFTRDGDEVPGERALDEYARAEFDVGHVGDLWATVTFEEAT